MASLLALARLVSTLSKQHIVVMVILLLVFLECSNWEFDGELTILIGSHHRVGNSLTLARAPAPPPAPLVAVQSHLHLSIRHWHATIGQSLACNFHGLVTCEHVARVGERDSKSGGFILTHVHRVLIEVRPIFLTSVKVQGEPPVQAVGGNCELSSHTAVSITFQV